MKTALSVLSLILTLLAVVPLPARAMQSDYLVDSDATVVVTRPQYRVTGEKALRPESIRDDGVHTYLIWHPDQALPAVFAINASGDEEIVDGYMRDGVFTIDRVYAKLVFRIDRKTAKAERLTR